MIVKNLKIFSQNIHKNSIIINTILETQNQFDILLTKNCPGLKFAKSQVLQIAMANWLWAHAIILIGSLLLGLLPTVETFQEPSPMLTFVFPLFISSFTMTFSITGISILFLFQITISAIIF